MLRYCATLFVSLLLFGGTGHALIILEATLTNAQENPPVGTATLPLLTGPGSANPLDPRPVSFGTATFVLDEAIPELSFTATIFNIDFTGSLPPPDQTPGTFDNLVAAHIHAGPLVTPLTNGPVVWGFFGMPFNDTIPNSNTAFVPFATGVGGTVSGTWDSSEGNGGTTLAAQLPFILAGQSYINFHTTQFGGGEVRGQITKVPEPSTMLLLSLGALGLMGFATRSRRRSQ